MAVLATIATDGLGGAAAPAALADGIGDAFLAAGAIAAVASVVALVILPSARAFSPEARARPSRRRSLIAMPPARPASARAGVVPATIYVHFPTRESLIDAVIERAMTEAAAVIEAAEPERGDAADALRRVVASAWRTLGRYHALVEINTRLSQAQLRSKHHAVLASLTPLIERGRPDGSFRADVPAEWHLSMLLALIHAASAEVRAGRVAPERAADALSATVIGAISA